MNIEEIRAVLERYINTVELTDYEVLKIYEVEMTKRNSFLRRHLKKGGDVNVGHLVK